MSAETVDQMENQAVPPRQWIRLTLVYLLIPLILRTYAVGGRKGVFGWAKPAQTPPFFS